MYQYKLIKEASLPPKYGYVEDENEFGERVYRPTEETVERLTKEADEAEAILNLMYDTALLKMGVNPDGI